jgi:membrane protease YdiL (CAAX protease family)
MEEHNMPSHILTPEVRIYGVTIAVAMCLGTYSLASHLRDNWLVRWKQLEFWTAHLLAMCAVIVWACIFLNPVTMFQTSLMKGMLSIQAGIVLGWAVIRVDRWIVRFIARRSLSNGTRETVGQRRSRIERRPGWTVRPVGSTGGPSDRKNTSWSARRSDRSAKPLSSVWVLVAIGVLEEIIFRGFLVEACFMIPSRAWMVLALIGSVLVFALAHVQFGWAQVFAKLPLGALTIASVLALGTVIPAILIHAIFNWSVWRDTDGDLRVLFQSSFF